MTAPKNGAELLERFGDYSVAGYVDPIQLRDSTVGFSIQKNYPPDIRFKPAKGKNGDDDDVAVVWVVYEAGKRRASDALIPLRLRIATMSKYRAKHWDYDFLDQEGPTEDSVILSKSTPRPLDLNLINEYFYSERLNSLVNSKGIVVHGVEILERLFKAHCDSVHPFKGIRWQGVDKAQRVTRWLFDQPVNFFLWVLTVVFGRTLDERRDRSVFSSGYLWEDFKKISVDSLEVAGYRTSKRVVVIFLTIVVSFCGYSFPVDERTYLGTLVKSEFLLAIHSLALLLMLDQLFPAVFFWMLNRSIRLRRWYVNLLLTRAIF